LSLKYKLLFFLTFIPAIALIFYLWLAVKLFSEDKEAYVYGSNVTLSKAIGAQISSELNAHIESLLPIIAQYDPTAEKLRDEAKLIFSKQKKIIYVSFNKFQEGKFAEKVFLEKAEQKKEYEAALKHKQTLLSEAAKTGFSFKAIGETNSYVMMAIADKKTGPDGNTMFFVSHVPQIINVLNASENVSNYLISTNGHIEMKPQQNDIFEPGVNTISYFNEPQWTGINEGSSEYQSGDRTVLSSYSKVGLGDLKVISLVDKQFALMGVKNLIKKSTYCLMMILSVCLFMSLFVSNTLTSSLRLLYQATKEVATGNFNVKLQVKSSDEVGGLSESFNHMAGEVSRLLAESSEKARMEGELATARTVQETLFPPATATVGNLEICGYYQPASECGGDWWHYCEIGPYVYIWIGDATGHGAAAALITSAARSAAAVIENFNEITPGQVLALVNNSIHSTSKGKMMMTFFLAAVHRETGQVVYCNASHESPYILRNKRPLEKGDLEIMDQTNGPRLGHERNSAYPEAAAQLSDGDMVLFYTDGIPELHNKENKTWGERRYIKAIFEATETPTLNDFHDTLKERIEKFRDGSDLKDDVTFVIIKFRQGTAQQAA
jgi:phosphoserine phosphatase RsbU/P